MIVTISIYINILFSRIRRGWVRDLPWMSSGQLRWSLREWMSSGFGVGELGIRHRSWLDSVQLRLMKPSSIADVKIIIWNTTLIISEFSFNNTNLKRKVWDEIKKELSVRDKLKLYWIRWLSMFLKIELRFLFVFFLFRSLVIWCSEKFEEKCLSLVCSDRCLILYMSTSLCLCVMISLRLCFYVFVYFLSSLLCVWCGKGNCRQCHLPTSLPIV